MYISNHAIKRFEERFKKLYEVGYTLSGLLSESVPAAKRHLPASFVEVYPEFIQEGCSYFVNEKYEMMLIVSDDHTVSTMLPLEFLYKNLIYKNRMKAREATIYSIKKSIEDQSIEILESEIIEKIIDAEGRTYKLTSASMIKTLEIDGVEFMFYIRKNKNSSHRVMLIPEGIHSTVCHERTDNDQRYDLDK